MEHANLDPVLAILCKQRRQKRRATRIGRFSGPAKTIRQHGDFEIGVLAERLVQCCDQFVLCLANVECRQIYSCFSVSNFVLSR